MRKFGALALLLPLAGCITPGPRAETTLPLAPAAAGNAAIAPIRPEHGPAQVFVEGGHVPARWWQGFASPALDALVEQALAGNNDIAAADAALRQARSLAGATAAGALPQVTAGYSAQRAKASDIVSPPLADPNDTLYTLHTAQLSVTYPLDVFGGGRAKIRSARAAAEAQDFRTRAARTTVVANLVLAVIQHAQVQEQLAAARQAMAAGRDLLALLQRRRELGAAGDADVAAQEATLAALEASVPGLERTALHQQALIAAFIGVAPGTPLPPLPTLADLHLPAELPVAVPSQLVAERPDVRAAAAQMKGAAADVGAAIAARLPAFQISGNVGGSALKFGEMFADGNLFWQVLGEVAQPIFDGGQLLKQKHAADAAFVAAKAQYRASALQAFVDVSDALEGLSTDAAALDAAARGDGAAARSLAYTLRQNQLGGVGVFDLRNAEVARAQAAQTYAQAKAARLADTVALYQALGAGVVAGEPRK
ncbi:MAG TPA: efflux transporter outer membrane subunit [Novosphingobium sp.]|nr:efflux transporter outer membrane subunit [Novosphingobium sp.]